MRNPTRTRSRGKPRRGLIAVALLGLTATVAVLVGQAVRDSSDDGPGAVVAGPRPFLPYSSDSFFRSTLEGAPIDRAATDSFRSFMREHRDQDDHDYPVIRGVGRNRWGTVYAEGRRSDPVWRLTGRVPREVAVLRSQGFHAPEWLGEALTRTSDSPFVVVDRASGWSVWAAKAKEVGPQLIRVGAAGLFEHDSNGLDRRNPRSDSQVNYRSRGAIPDAMVIRRDLLAYAKATNGDLGHVLHMFFVETDSSAGYVHPMVGEESGKDGWGAAGERIAVAPDVDLGTRDCSPEALVIARTLQRHGAYLGDNSAQGTGLKAEQETDFTSWRDRLSDDELEGCIDWDDFVVVEPGWQ